jgi:hypothetical protein
MHTKFVYLIALLAGLALIGCEEEGDLLAPDEGELGRMIMYICDAPTDHLSEVNIIVGRVEVHSDTEGWFITRDEPDTIDLLTLKNGEIAVLSDTALPTGHYTQIRLHIEEGSYVVASGERHDLIIPSGFQTGIQLVGQFDIQSNEQIEVLLDFDVHRSIQHTNNGYQLQPTIRFQVLNVAGDLTGTVVPAEARALIAVSQAGEVITNTYANEQTGEFTVVGLAPGTYNILVVSREDESVYAEFPDVSIQTNSTTDLGTIVLEGDS